MEKGLAYWMDEKQIKKCFAQDRDILQILEMVKKMEAIIPRKEKPRGKLYSILLEI